MRENIYNDFVDQFIEKAKTYANGSSIKKYPGVYFSANKSLKWGITLPDVQGVCHTAVNLPDFVDNTNVNAIALMMACEDAITKDNGSYKAFCTVMGWGVRNRAKNKDIPRYILKGNYACNYKVSLPGTGHPVVLHDEDGSTTINGLGKAIRMRDSYMEECLALGYDEFGELSVQRIKSFERELVDSAFRSIITTYNSQEQSIQINKGRENLYLGFCRAWTYAKDLVERKDKAYVEISDALSDTLQLFESLEDGWTLEDDELSLICRGFDVVLNYAEGIMGANNFEGMKILLYYLVLKNQGREIDFSKKEAIIIAFNALRAALVA